MEQLTRKDLIEKWRNFYLSKGHKEIPSASVIPENDPSVLFNTAGMQPLVPYLLGKSHPLGKRLFNVQKCIRTNDIDEVGDYCHHTFFEMLGNWSLGDYFKDEAVAWSYEMLTKVLNIPKDRLAFTVFKGNEQVKADEYTAKLWIKQGVDKDRIAYLPAEDNWWPSMDLTGPCGSDTEMFYWTDNNNKAPKKFNPEDKRWMEIWNNVFMEFNHTTDGKFEPLKQKNIDTGMGLERTIAVLNSYDDNYLTDIWRPIIKLIENLTGKSYNDFKKEMRIIADHIRTATFILGDEHSTLPSNTGAGYILRRLIRRAIRTSKTINLPKGSLSKIALEYVSEYKSDYPELERNKDIIVKELNNEEEKFSKTLEDGTKEFEKVINSIIRKREFMQKQNPNAIVENIISGKQAFRLYDTFGFPIEMTIEMAKERGFNVDKNGFDNSYKEHQELARTTSAGMFKGGLADTSEQTTRLHTAVHLMLGALRKVLGENVHQKGSNITSERARFDFSFDRKLTDEEIKQVEDIVNEAIKKGIDVQCSEMTLEEAKNSGALGEFENKYGEKVTVYNIPGYSKEICGGPHAKNTAELKNFKIIKQEASSAGVRRIKAIINF